MRALNKVMTHNEAECFRALRRWQRTYLKGELKKAFIPKIPFGQQLRESGLLVKFLCLLVIVILLPLVTLFWLLNLFRGLLLFPIQILLSHFKPPGLRAPGERNIQGVHNQFARHIELPPELYLKCLDDWVGILYGPDKLPEYSISRYLDSHYLLHRTMTHGSDPSIGNLLSTQISGAREELSRSLGHYR